MKTNIRSQEKRKNPKQVSNNFLVVLILASILFSVVGTWISLSKLSPLTGLVSSPGLVNVTVNRSLAFTLTPTSVNFTGLGNNDADNTTDLTPKPFNLTNDGNVLINISIAVTSLWLTAGSPTALFQCRCGNTTVDGNCSQVVFPSIINFTNCPTSATVFIPFLDWADGNDTNYLHVNVTVPSGEPGGFRESTITFTAADAKPNSQNQY
ncbi:MAG TPA: hypothetical protein VJH20_05855 [Candidatus Nanoarchaeia archaeon]|nr:hypothetical protein [Candidatus Nanoarchaeia archaeon]